MYSMLLSGDLIATVHDSLSPSVLHSVGSDACATPALPSKVNARAALTAKNFASLSFLDVGVCVCVCAYHYHTYLFLLRLISSNNLVDLLYGVM